MHKLRSATMPGAPTAATPSSRQGFQDIDTITSTTGDGLTCVISQRRKSRELTFAIFRIWHNAEGAERTSFCPQRLGEEYLKLVQSAILRMTELRRNGGLPFGDPP